VVARGSGRDAETRSPRRQIGRIAALCVVAVASAVTLSGCSAKNAFALGWPHGGISKQSHEMYNLWIGTVIAAAVVGLIVYALIFWCIIRYRKRKGSDDTLPAQTRYNLPIELIYTVIPFLIIAVLFYYTARAETDVDKISAHPDVTVSVIAFKWNWEFQYDNRQQLVRPDPGPADERDDRVRRAQPGRHPLVLGAGAAVQARRDPRLHQPLPGDAADHRCLRRPLRGTLWHLSLADELRAVRDHAYALRAVPCRSAKGHEHAERARGHRIHAERRVRDDDASVQHEPYRWQRDSVITKS
jgi:heme/copper-type cytochrome/quinol oxidase subunit 2